MSVNPSLNVVRSFDWSINSDLSLIAGLQVKPEKAGKPLTVGGGTVGSVVQGSRTAVMMGGGEVDLDRVAASMADTASVSSHSSQPGQAKQLGRSIAGAFTGNVQLVINANTDF